MTKDQKSKSKQKLIEAMAELLLKKGLANTSPQDIFTLSGIGKGSLYHHFKGKEDLAFYAIKYNVDQLILATDEVLSTESTPCGKLRAILEKTRNIERGCLIGQMARDSKIMTDDKLAPEVSRGFEWMKSQIEKLIREGINDNCISDNLAPLEATILILTTLQGAYVVAKGLRDDTYFKIALASLLKTFIK
ncbi:putative TetR-family transcriptional regulator [Moritella sp. PE36]|uniref:TetR/AcrR family transcriptional regulator n=1 Tax=Moritella sp. PE36 TaxID=58051 RepID=UPI000156824A|nr:TetR/AcrR family transcriptional regulator [Moritella sp. PE36]EDM67218.1 putative TetR-family transcriptional regulator [Moritella sp. PE36]